MSPVLRTFRKEFSGFFASPQAFIFFGAFLAVTLFVFFWVERFFARNIADVRPLFEWMPVLLIFLAAAITMRMWSEEQRAGTLELLLTSPVRPLQLVMGKFLACVALVCVALALTLPLPLTVSFLGDLDWGPVFGGYLATLFLAAAYISIGLYVSSRTENQVVSLIIAALICGVFFLVGSDALTGLFGNRTAELLKLFGTGSRFESITRGVIDLRDLYFYLSVVGAFLALNVLALEQRRWAGNPRNANHRQWVWLTALLAANLLVGNLLLHPLATARADVTAGRIYSISDSTRAYLSQLREPLLIRGYFSAQTHPLLAPLVPRLRDLLEEYAVAGGDRVRVEFVDPQTDPEMEEEAGRKYGISPVPFQTASKYQASVVNSYFDILIKYGDQYETLGFDDLIDVKAQSESDLEVELRNPEYDITRTIKKVLYGYQGTGELFENITRPVVFRGYLSPADRLPEALASLRTELESLLSRTREASDGKFSFEILDPDANGGELGHELERDFGFRPMVAGLLDDKPFWFYMTLHGDGQVVQVPLPESLDAAGLERGLDAGLKHFSTGFLKTVALVTPEPPAPVPGMMPQTTGPRFDLLREKLSEEYAVRDADLKNGYVPEEADLLMLVAPSSLDEKQIFAVDQFLMRGGTVIIASSAFDIDTRGSLSAAKATSGLEGWLASKGIEIGSSMVLDPQNAAFPIPVQRHLGGFTVQETRMVEYPYFVDVREDGFDRDNTATSGINQVTVTWASPITLDDAAQEGRRVTRMIESSNGSWLSESTDIQPDFRTFGPIGFAPGEDRARHLLGVIVEGGFESWFLDKPSPLAGTAETSPGDDAPETADTTEQPGSEDDAPAISRVIGRSPESARIILFSSNSFLSDTTLNLATAGLGTVYLNPVELVENAVDWSLEDRGLLQIRGRAQFSRTLEPLDNRERAFWEYLNYALALASLALVWFLWRQSSTRSRARYRAMLAAEEG
jgi:ABC-2 type transport system permease protein